MHKTFDGTKSARTFGLVFFQRYLIAFKQFLFANTLTKTHHNEQNPLFWPLGAVCGVVAYKLSTGRLFGDFHTRAGQAFMVLSDFRLSLLTLDSLFIFFATLMVLYTCYMGLCSPYRSARGSYQSKMVEFFWLVVMSGFCGVALLSSSNLISFYTAVEGLSLVTFFLLARHASRAGSKELFFKYFCFSSYSSVLLGGGFGMLYLLTQSLDFNTIKSTGFAANCGSILGDCLQVGATTFQQLLIVCSWLVILGFMFKLGSFPFHFIVPDLYEASSVLFLTFYNFVLKHFYLLSLILVLWAVFSEHVAATCTPLMVVSGCGSLLAGTLGAYIQRNFWRFLGYASVAQTGLVVLGLAANTPQAVSATLVFFWGYLGATLLIFLLSSLLLWVKLEGGGRKATGAPAGFGYISDVGSSLARLTLIGPSVGMLAFCVFCAALLSFAALPPFVGFVTKYVLILQMVRAESIFLALLVVILNLLSTYYYLRVVEKTLLRIQLKTAPIAARAAKKRPSGLLVASKTVRPAFLLGSCPTLRHCATAGLAYPLAALLAGFLWLVVKLNFVSGLAKLLVINLMFY